jgi:LuxR family maltose regulon positive regulatory protein
MQFIEERDSQHLGAIGLVNIGLARLLYEWNDLEAANARIRQSVDYMRWWDKPDDRAVACITLANVSCALGDIRGAGDALWRARQIVDTQHVFPDTSQAVETAQVKWWLSRGDLASAAGWAERRQLHESDPLAFRDELEWMALARVRIAQALDDPHSPALEEARGWLARLAEAACAARRTGHLIEILALQALALNAQHSIAQAVTVLQQSLILAEPEGYVRVFVDEGTRMADLLARAAERGIAPEYARKLLAAFSDEGRTTKDEGPLRATEDERPSPMSSVARSGPSSSVESLTERELEVLGLVAAGASNRAIAEALVVSVGTVKTHISRIMSKLGAGNRTEAVARARQLGIL